MKHWSTLVIECCKTNNNLKVITMTNQKKENTFKNQWELKVKTTKLPEVQENAGDQVVIDFGFASNIIGWESGASFLDQSQSEVKLKQSNWLLLTLDWKLFYQFNKLCLISSFPLLILWFYLTNILNSLIITFLIKCTLWSVILIDFYFNRKMPTGTWSRPASAIRM